MQMFNLQSIVSELATQEILLGLFLVGAGLVFMLLGFRIYKSLIVISFGVIGFAAGHQIPLSVTMQWVAALVGMVVLGFLSTLLIKLSVSLLAGGWAGLAMLGLFDMFNLGNQITIIMGVVGFAVAVSLTLIMYEEIIALITSLEGTLMFLAGLIVFASHNAGLWDFFSNLLFNSVLFFPFLILAGTVTGFYFQLAELRQKESGMSSG